MQPGEYEVRYILGQGDTVIATQKVTVGAVSASVTVPAQVAAGARLSVNWTGPANPRDYITVVKSGAAEQTWGRYEYITKGNPLPFVAPDAPGEYEVRYLTGQGNVTLARAKLTVGAVTGTLTGPAQAVAGESFKVTWKGPDNPRNFITVVPKGAREGEYSASYAYTTAAGQPGVAGRAARARRLRAALLDRRVLLHDRPRGAARGAGQAGAGQDRGDARARRQARRHHRDPSRRLRQHAAEVRQRAAHRRRQADADQAHLVHHPAGHAVRAAHLSAAKWMPARRNSMCRWAH